MNIALVAHDNCKKDLVRWAREHVNELKGHRLTCTGTTGRLIDAACLATRARRPPWSA